MKKLTLLLLFLILTACSPEIPSLETPPPAENLSPSLTPTPFQVMLPNIQASRPTPAGTPLTEWNTIPIMPGALAAEETGNTYLFTTPASLAEIKAYYLEQLPNAGWRQLSEGEGPDHLTLVFEKDGAQLHFTLNFLADQNKSFVTIQR